MTLRTSRCALQAARIDFARAGPMPEHLADAARVAVEDLERLDAEALDDAARELGPDALDEARAEVAADAVERRGRDLGVARDAELLAEARRRLVAPLHAQRRARRHAQQAAHDGHDVAAALELEARHRERAVAAREDDAIDRALERLLGSALARLGRALEQIHCRVPASWEHGRARPSTAPRPPA